MDKFNIHNIFIFLIIITILAFILRFTNLADNPPGLTVDEVSSGYNSYSILKTGKDEYGNFLPLSFRSLNDYKPPFYIYASTIPIAFFGLNEFSIRFLSAFTGTLTIPLSFFLFKKISKNENIALVGALFFTISPWHIYYSRLGFESPVAMSFVMAGIYCFLRMLEGKIKWIILSGIFLLLSLYTYHAERVFAPLFILFLIFLYRKKLKKTKKVIITFFSVSGVLFLPLLFSLLFSPAASRIGMTLITKDPSFLRNTLTETIPTSNLITHILLNSFANEQLLLPFFILNKFISYLSPTFLFFNGLNMTHIGSFGLGLLYLFEIPFFVLGILYYFRAKSEASYIIIGWIILGLIPALITQDDFNPIRTLLIIPMVILISSTGAIISWKLIHKIKNTLLRKMTIILGLNLISWNLIFAFFVFSVHFPYEKSEDFLYGSKQSAIFAQSQKNNYREIVLSPLRGKINPDIRSVPHLYILFYSKYDPISYQNIPKLEKQDSYSFDAFTIRPIDWAKDKNKKGTLFIGSPWDFNDPDIRSDQIKKRFYLLNGDLILMAVST